MNEIIKILQQEIQSIKMKLSAQIEENVRLKGFKQIVMDAPKKFAKEIDYHRYWKEKAEKAEKKNQELENEMILVKGITVTNSPELRAEQKKVKELEDRLAEVLSIEDDHQKLNGKLNMRVAELEEFNIKVRQEVTIKEQEILELHADNKKLASQVEDSVDRMRKAGIL
jgi:hypothetical protein